MRRITLISQTGQRTLRPENVRFMSSKSSDVPVPDVKSTDDSPGALKASLSPTPTPSTPMRLVSQAPRTTFTPRIASSLGGVSIPSPNEIRNLARNEIHTPHVKYSFRPDPGNGSGYYQPNLEYLKTGGSFSARLAARQWDIQPPKKAPIQPAKTPALQGETTQPISSKNTLTSGKRSGTRNIALHEAVTIMQREPAAPRQRADNPNQRHSQSEGTHRSRLDTQGIPPQTGRQRPVTWDAQSSNGQRVVSSGTPPSRGGQRFFDRGGQHPRGQRSGGPQRTGPVALGSGGQQGRYSGARGTRGVRGGRDGRGGRGIRRGLGGRNVTEASDEMDYMNPTFLDPEEDLIESTVTADFEETDLASTFNHSDTSVPTVVANRRRLLEFAGGDYSRYSHPAESTEGKNPPSKIAQLTLSRRRDVTIEDRERVVDIINMSVEGSAVVRPRSY